MGEYNLSQDNNPIDADPHNEENFDPMTTWEAPESHSINLPNNAKEEKKIKVITYNHNGQEYSFKVSLQNTVQHVKNRALSHYNYESDMQGYKLLPNGDHKYRLVCVRNFKNLVDENSLAEENIMNNEKLLLVKYRCPNEQFQMPSSFEHGQAHNDIDAITPEIIAAETGCLKSVNLQRQAEPSTPLVDIRIAIRRIILTLIEASTRLISVEENAVSTFIDIFMQLEKRQKSGLDKTALKQLIDMGFNEKRAMYALNLKRNAASSMEWLIDELNIDNVTEVETDIFDMNLDEASKYFLGGTDPATNVMKEFKKYVYRWFQPDLKALQILQDLGYGEDVSLEALRTTHNNEQIALQLLEGDNMIALEMNEGYARNLPIMAAIMESHFIQLALPKPKTLFALMKLCENSLRANVWLSDADTQSFVGQILRTYHAEKYRLSNITDDKDSPPQSSSPNLTSFNLHERAENPCSTRLSSSRTPSLPLGQAGTSTRANVYTETIDYQLDDNDVHMEEMN